MVILDIDMPESCEKCNAGSSCWYEAEIEEFSFRRAFCINGRDITDMDCSCRPDWCPLVEVKPKVIRERTSHITWEKKTVYVRKNNEAAEHELRRGKHESAPEDEKKV